MKQETKETLRPIFFFLVGFIGFQLLWWLVIYPVIN